MKVFIFIEILTNIIKNQILWANKVKEYDKETLVPLILFLNEMK